MGGCLPSSHCCEAGVKQAEGNFTLILRQAQDRPQPSPLKGEGANPPSPRQRRVAFGDWREGVRGRGNRSRSTPLRTGPSAGLRTGLSNHERPFEADRSAVLRLMLRVSGRKRICGVNVYQDSGT